MLSKALEMTLKIGATYMGGVLYSALKKYDKPPTKDGLNYSIEIIRDLCNQAKNKEIFSTMNDINYDGPITFESFSSTVVEPKLSNTLGVWRNLWDDSDDLASKAKTYIENLI